MGGDPNAEGRRAARRELLLRTRGAPVGDRLAFLADRVRGLDVLDVGCVDHDSGTSEGSGWLHGALAAAARSCLGVDVLEEDVALLREKGYDVQVLDITGDPLDRRFDAIVCGELLEHVGNPERMFVNCRAMLRDGGSLLLTTPNPWYANILLEALFSRDPVVDNVEHVAWYDPGVLAELADRAGLELAAWHGIPVKGAPTRKARLFFALAPLWRLFGIRREVFCKRLLYILKPSSREGGPR